MMLSEITASLPEARIEGDAAVAVTDVAYDSRTVVPGALFFAVRGETSDGHAFVGDAVTRGATAVVVERVTNAGVPEVVVPSVRRSMGPIASAFFGAPSAAMRVVGVTGTNGKTTTTFMLERCFSAAGMSSGLIGTVETHVGDERLPVTRTTPEGVDLQRLLARMRDAGVGAVAMEVSSHGLELGRVAGTTFAAGVFTNLTQDHLDFHGTMEAYYRAKATLFDGSLARCAVINADDEYGRRLVVESAVPVTTYSLLSQSADVVATSIEMDRAGSEAVVTHAGGRSRLRVPIPGRYNVANALAACGAMIVLGYPIEAALDGIASLTGVPGRLEPVDGGQPFSVLVDYAHTPDSLERVLRAAREVCERELWVVFGCGGDRDRGKRPLMGEIGARLADHAIVTSDNPRSEDPTAIVAEIEAGARTAGRAYEVEVDRRLAIRRAIEGARAGDVVVIAGKGHESGQQFADRTVPFDDRIVAREEIARCFG